MSVSNLSIGQEEGSWWKRLFKKETVEEIEKEEPSIEIDKTDKVEDEVEVPVVDESSPELDSAQFYFGQLRKSDVPGEIAIHHSYALDSLNGIYQEKDNYGYRIQIYFGELNSAKSRRANFMSKRSQDKCYIELRAPNYAVLVGDYRDLFEAHQRLFIIQESYPNAMIVQSEIEN